ncbi:hypothetical protein RHSIM_Rhsim01G0117700 [Rhododendron simsii]|uniref:Protein kinase domain-containing protein n=1 Tax=Rhododendron simsii TaxID=118357 RepID=A0A834HIG9_RHOSS|nr:hypothetical protein RHSIM_Rhsim01G0117700 [Rhododendron simsii]
MASVGVAPASGLREFQMVGVDRLPEEMNDMKIRDDKEMEATVVDGNGTETGYIIVTTIGGRNGQPKQTINYRSERIVGPGSFGVVFQAKCLETGESVAIKKVLQAKRYKNRELLTMCLLDHPNLVSSKHCVFSTTEKDELYLNLVLEYVPETIHHIACELSGDFSGDEFGDLGVLAYANDHEGLEGLPIQVNPMRFRPNLVISGGVEHHAEDEGRSLKIGNEIFLLFVACNCCLMINLNSQEGEVRRSKEPLATLASYRRVKGKTWIHGFRIQLWCCPPRADPSRKPVGEFGDSMDILGGSRRQYRSLLNGYPLTSVVNLFKFAIMCVEDESVERPTMREVMHMPTNPPQSATAPPLFTLQYFGAATFSWRGMHSRVRSRSLLLLFPSQSHG